MAPNSNKNLGGGWAAPKNPATMLQDCKRPTCRGVCPLKVVVAKHGSANPARCRVCERKFTIPPGAEKLFHGKDTTNKGGKHETNQIKLLKQQLAQKDKALAEMQKIPQDSAEKADADEKPKQTLADLQNALRVCMQEGCTEEAKGLEKKIAEFNNSSDNQKAGDPCRAILGKLNAAKNREMQLQEQLRKDFDKLEVTKKKLLEASADVLIIQDKKDKLFSEHGHNGEAPGAATLPAPKGLTPEQTQMWKTFVDGQQEAMRQLFAKMLVATPPQGIPHPSSDEPLNHSVISESDRAKRGREEELAAQPPGVSPDANTEGGVAMAVSQEADGQGRAKAQKGADGLPMVTAEELPVSQPASSVQNSHSDVSSTIEHNSVLGIGDEGSGTSASTVDPNIHKQAQEKLDELMGSMQKEQKSKEH